MNLQEDISRIKQVMGINESESIRFKRILHQVDYIVNHIKVYPDYESEDFCRVFYDPKAFINTVISEVADSLYHNYFEDLDDGAEQWGNIYNMIVDYVEKKHGRSLTDYWISICQN